MILYYDDGVLIFVVLCSEFCYCCISMGRIIMLDVPFVVYVAKMRTNVHLFLEHTTQQLRAPSSQTET